MRNVNETPMIHDRHLVKAWLEAILQRDDYKNGHGNDRWCNAWRR